MSMPFARTIEDESRMLLQTSSDLDNFRRFYSLVEEHPTEDILVKFVAPKIIAFEDYRFYLLQNSVIKPVSPTNFYRPDYVSYEEYDTINYWALLLYINDIPTIEDFTKEQILVPTKQSLIDLTRGVSKKDLLHEIVPLYDLPPKPTAALYMRKENIPSYRNEPVAVPSFIPTDVYFMKDNFTLDVVDIRQRFVELTNEPIANSVRLSIQGKPNYIYGKHYLMIKGSIGKNKLTWDPKNIPDGIGLVSVLVEGDQIEVSYARKTT